MELRDVHAPYIESSVVFKVKFKCIRVAWGIKLCSVG